MTQPGMKAITKRSPGKSNKTAEGGEWQVGSRVDGCPTVDSITEQTKDTDFIKKQQDPSSDRDLKALTGLIRCGGDSGRERVD